MKCVATSALAVLAACAIQGVSRTSAADLPERAINFETRSGETVDAFEGAFTVLENRTDPDSRTLTLHYVRFPATGDSPGAPIVYLAGGPGGSGIWFAGSWRFPLFMAMREFGDVIAFDQRGTGESDDTPICTSSQVLEDTAFVSDSAFFEAQRAALKECIAFWKDKGVDLRGYTTPESVEDLDALRRHLGAKKLSLWGMSYGSHLALAALKQMDDHLEKVVITSAEGLDQTIKQPARTDEYFSRLQEAVDTQPAAKEEFPDIKALIRRVHARLDAAPLKLNITQRSGDAVEMVFQRRDMQMLASTMIADPNRFAAQLLRIYAALDKGDTQPLIAAVPRWRNLNAAISFKAMPVMMDIASGIGAERRTLVEAQAETALLGPYLNDTFYLMDAAPSYELGEGFRKKPVSDTPVLLLSGTLDGRTYGESQREAVSGLTNRQLVTVRNAGHNLFMSSPEVTQTIQDFMRGEVVDGREIVVKLPEFHKSGE